MQVKAQGQCKRPIRQCLFFQPLGCGNHHRKFGQIHSQRSGQLPGNGFNTADCKAGAEIEYWWNPKAAANLPGPANPAASRLIRPQFSRPPQVHPADTTSISLAISFFTNSTVNTSWPLARRLEQPTTAATPLMLPAAIRSINGAKLPLL